MHPSLSTIARVSLCECNLAANFHFELDINSQAVRAVHTC